MTEGSFSFTKGDGLQGMILPENRLARDRETKNLTASPVAAVQLDQENKHVYSKIHESGLFTGV